MRHPRKLVLLGCLAALIVMTILSAVVGWAAPNLVSVGYRVKPVIATYRVVLSVTVISRKWTHHITTLLFFGFGLWSLWDAFMENG
ncbi:hypothetical protein Godav_000682 [Gossypium davidsonii]|uniref:Uncharacterized protein n=2 Tax=Gossypium TaxID=3633 RepID=A0A7J8T0D8_GOSDV|nr:hypothetical protein [Gossypium davidsonii]MBA0667584.1 hypothetical protein [Gossypium klotzschianum]